MKYKVTVITDDHGKVLGAMRSEMKVGENTLSFHASPQGRNKYHQVEIDEEIMRKPAHLIAAELAKHILVHK